MSRSASHVYEPPVNPPAEAVRHPGVPAGLPPLTFDRQGIRALDRAAIEEFGIPGIVLMENAARGVTKEVMHMLNHPGEATPMVVLICGSGNNGGDGYGVARHLHNRGVGVLIVPLEPPRPGSDAAINAAICNAMRLRMHPLNEIDRLMRNEHCSLIVDAVFGTGLDREVHGIAAQAIHWMNSAPAPVLAVDVPSGLDCDSGAPLGVAVQATRTATFVGPKIGFAELHAQSLLGEVSIVDIGVPRELAERYGKRLESSHPEVPEHDVQAGVHRRPGEI